MNKRDICQQIFSSMSGNEKLLNRVIEVSSIKSIRRKDYIVRFGEEQRYLYFIVEGIVRGFVDKSSTQEITDCIVYTFGAPVIAAIAIDKVEKSPQNLQALTDVTLLAVPISEIRVFLKNYTEVKDLYIYWLIESLQQHINLIHARSLNDEGRCRWLLKQKELLSRKIQKQYLASYLDMTLSSYGRAMKKVLEKDGQQ